ncbi:MAG: glycoside hydrolase family 15 protein, partial [Bdellovibrionales bacterium]|nr:glycoside hydrolase family 15 protein [Bdellovibrionales bacterium]
MGYLPIEDHGVIGDLYTVALVGIDGTIDWCCLPHFDSPSVFASILDDTIGGCFKLSSEETVKSAQMYHPDSNILVTRSFTKNGLGQIEDFMPISRTERRKVHQIIRKVSCVRGEIQYTLECKPAFNYAQSRHSIRMCDGGAIFETGGRETFALQSPIALSIKGGAATTTFTLAEGDALYFVFFRLTEDLSGDPFQHIYDPAEQFEHTRQFWQRWVQQCTYRGRWRDMVYRSALTLKLLTFEPTGAIVAAPTMGLPEEIGGFRNWDYRYTWIRDASFTIYAFMRIGYFEEAERFMNWLAARCDEIDTKN